MNWKRNMGAILLASVFILGFTRCSKWTETENMDVFEYGNTETNKPDSYYKALREWKKTKHSVSFGWFSGWGDGGSQTFNMLAGIPDSMDIVSLWSNWSNLSEAQKRDLKQVQEQKALEPTYSRNIIKLQIINNQTLFGVHSKSKSF